MTTEETAALDAIHAERAAQHRAAVTASASILFDAATVPSASTRWAASTA